MPKVSVVLPAYNGEKFIGKAVESALSQTYNDFELIVVNDGSKDGTAQVLSGFGAKIKVISQANSGIAKARNVGIEASRGQYIAFLDQDDFWLPEKLEKQMVLFEKDKEVGMTYTDTYVITDDNAKIRSFKLQKPHRGMVIEELFMNNFISTSSVIVKKECFEKAGLFDDSLSPVLDYDRWLNIAVSYKVDYIDIPLVMFRDHISTFRKNEIFTLGKAIATLEKFINSNAEVRDALGKRADKKIASFYILLGRRLLAKGDSKQAFFNFYIAVKMAKSISTFFHIVNSVFFDFAKNVLKNAKVGAVKF